MAICCVLSHVRNLLRPPWTVTRPAPVSMEPLPGKNTGWAAIPAPSCRLQGRICVSCLCTGRQLLHHQRTWEPRL